MRDRITLVAGIFFFSVLLLVACRNKASEKMPALSGTVWVCPVGEDCTDSLYFRQATHRFFGCELLNEGDGTWQVNKDTLYLLEPDQADDSIRFKVVYYQHSLRFVERQERKQGRWANTGYEFPESYSFYKLQ